MSDTDITVEEYLSLLERITILRKEAQLDMKLRGIRWSHLLGKTIREHAPWQGKVHDRSGRLQKLLTRLSPDVGMSEASLNKYIALYDKYPDIEKAISEYGGAVSLRKLLGESSTDMDETDKMNHILRSAVRILEKIRFLGIIDEEESLTSLIDSLSKKYHEI